MDFAPPFPWHGLRRARSLRFVASLSCCVPAQVLLTDEVITCTRENRSSIRQPFIRQCAEELQSMMAGTRLEMIPLDVLRLICAFFGYSVTCRPTAMRFLAQEASFASVGNKSNTVRVASVLPLEITWKLDRFDVIENVGEIPFHSSFCMMSMKVIDYVPTLYLMDLLTKCCIVNGRASRSVMSKEFLNRAFVEALTFKVPKGYPPFNPANERIVIPFGELYFVFAQDNPTIPFDARIPAPAPHIDTRLRVIYGVSFSVITQEMTTALTRFHTEMTPMGTLLRAATIRIKQRACFMAVTPDHTTSMKPAMYKTLFAQQKAKRLENDYAKLISDAGC